MSSFVCMLVCFLCVFVGVALFRFFVFGRFVGVFVCLQVCGRLPFFRLCARLCWSFVYRGVCMVLYCNWVVDLLGLSWGVVCSGLKCFVFVWCVWCCFVLFVLVSFWLFCVDWCCVLWA